ncbi:MAG: TRAP transporter large permease [Chloroflexi bacterium]|nr:TRAP transporter large permease [Chloroflexota bacterium]
MDSPLVALSAVFLVLIFVGVPVGYSMILTSASYLYLINPGMPPTLIAQRPIGMVAESFTLLAVPLFLLAGNLLNACGMTERLVAFAVAAVGHVRGGLGHAVVVANVVMSGMSGSATADAAGIGSIMIPSLKKAGFSAASSAALTASAATIGPIIPPSVAMVLYSSLSNVSLGRLLLAGVIPGLVIGLFLMITLTLSAESGRMARTAFDGRHLLRAGRDAVFALIMPGIILGGMFSGVYTPTEGAAAAVAYALLIGVTVYRSLTPAAIFTALRESARMTGGVLFVVATATGVSWIMTAERVGDTMRGMFLPFQSSPELTLLIIALVTLLLGTAMEETTMLVLMTPVLAPVVAQAGIDPVHFGLVFVLATMIGLITPPVGITMFITCQIAGITVNQFTRAVWRPFLALVLSVIVAAVWKDMVLFLPNLVLGQ